MTWGMVAVGGATLVSGYMQSNAAGKAANAQTQAAAMGIEEQRRQFDAIQELMKPYVTAGTGALQQQQEMLRGGGVEEAQASPAFQAMLSQGENAMLQNASATGGLRGGNVQAALAQFRPQLLAQELERRYARLGGITSLGQNAAAGVGNAGMQTGAAVSNLFAQQGAAQAGGILGRGQAISNVANLPMNIMGMQMAMGQKPGFGNLFGGSTPAAAPVPVMA